MTHWLAWGLFNKEVGALAPGEATELRALIGELEEAAGSPLPSAAVAGRGRTFHPMRASLEPVRWQHRPLFYYAVTTALVSTSLATAIYSPAALVTTTFTAYLLSVNVDLSDAAVSKHRATTALPASAAANIGRPPLTRASTA